MYWENSECLVGWVGERVIVTQFKVVEKVTSLLIVLATFELILTGIHV